MVLCCARLVDPNLDKYPCVDEVHERALNTDALIGFTKTILTLRLDLELIEASAAMDAERLSRFYGGAPEYIIPAARVLWIYRGCSWLLSASQPHWPSLLRHYLSRRNTKAHPILRPTKDILGGKGKSGAVIQAAE